MGLVLDSGVLIAAEREARPVSALLATLEQEHGETEITIACSPLGSFIPKRASTPDASDLLLL